MWNNFPRVYATVDVSLIVFKIIVLRWNFLLVACLTSAIKMQVKLGRYIFEEEKKLCKNMRIVNINQLVEEEWWFTLWTSSAGKMNKQNRLWVAGFLLTPLSALLVTRK